MLLPLLFLSPSDEEKRGEHGGSAKKEVMVLKKGFLKKTAKMIFYHRSPSLPIKRDLPLFQSNLPQKAYPLALMAPKK